MIGIEIPWRELSADALQGVIEEFVTREGTEYGLRDVALATKVSQVRAQLERGLLALYFNPVDATCQLLTRDDADRLARLAADAAIDDRTAGHEA